MEIALASSRYLDEIVRMALQLWPESDATSLTDEFSVILSDPDQQILLAIVNHRPVGFAHVSLRHEYVEGANHAPTGYLEGIFIEQGFRRSKIGTRLVETGEIWARERGCEEMASDCDINNIDSLRFHIAAGFHEVRRSVCFIKKMEAQG